MGRGWRAPEGPVGVEQVQAAGRADVEDGQVAGRSATTSIRTRSPVRSRTWSGGGGTFFMSRVTRPAG